MDLFDVEISFKPVRLTSIVADLQKRLDATGTIPSRFDVNSAIDSFLADYHNLPDPDFYSKWWRKKRYLKYFLFYLTVDTSNLSPVEKRKLTRLRTILIRLLEKNSDQLKRFIPLIGMVAFNNLSDDNLWELFLDKLPAYSGRREIVHNWKGIWTILRSPGKMAGEIVFKNLSIVNFYEKYKFENTDLGRQFVSVCCTEVIRTKKETDALYQKELFGDYFEKGNSEDAWGLLSKLNVELLAPFINGYCDRFSLSEIMPSQKDKILHYLKDDKIMGNPLQSNKWKLNKIHKHSRELMHRWIISKDFEIAFKRILEHYERHRYWVQWLNQIEMIRIFSPNSFALNTTLKNLDHRIEHLEYPTIFMKIGNALVIECGEKGMGGVYIYPYNDTIKWDKKLKNTRDYKSPILDHPSRGYTGAFTNKELPPGWGNISHHGGWQVRVTLFLSSQFSLNLPKGKLKL